MKVRVWNGQETLATINGSVIQDHFEAFEKWVSKYTEGEIQVWAGRWWRLTKETRPFLIQSGTVFCDHPSYASKRGLDPKDFSGFFVYEAWMIAARHTRFWSGIDTMATEIVNSTEDKGK